MQNGATCLQPPEHQSEPRVCFKYSLEQTTNAISKYITYMYCQTFGSYSLSHLPHLVSQYGRTERHKRDGRTGARATAGSGSWLSKIITFKSNGQQYHSSREASVKPNHRRVGVFGIENVSTDKDFNGFSVQKIEKMKETCRITKDGKGD